ncbi:Nuclear export mediator factor NEMF [Aphelenchoides besseyi]|nr:Nuclear export mediator factor NEMF [Aphelenchoides besseyi]
MKSKYTTTDVCAAVFDIRRLIGMRVVNVYDIDSKTYLLKLHKPNDKAFILFESGVRIHCTSHDWPKSQVPSGFSMKFRKHINQKRLTHVAQVGVDRIVDMTFGDEERACHVLVEVYDRGNVILTDADYKILNVLRPRTDREQDVRFSVKETYPLNLAQQETFLPSLDNIALFLESAKPEDLVRRALVRHVPFSGQLLEHGLIVAGMPPNAKIKDLGTVRAGTLILMEALRTAEEVSQRVREMPSKGFITYTKIERSDKSEGEIYEEYNPVCFAQHTIPDSQFMVKEFETFSQAVDNFYSLLDTQKLQQRANQAENEAIKKLNNVKKDHERRVKALEEVQDVQEKRAHLIQVNKEDVDACLTIVRQCLANKMQWDEIAKLIEMSAKRGNPYAKIFVRLNLAENTVVLRLSDPYEHLDEEYTNQENENDNQSENDQLAQKKKPSIKKGMDIEVDLDLTADQNCRKYFSDRKAAASKQQKTLQASKVALKNAQKQTYNKVQQVRTNTSLLRARKSMWFEKFYWCISTEGYLIIGGRDAQQNEMLVKRYLRPGDVYVHADLHGASSVVVRNNNREAEIPPMTLNEAGSMAVCFSSAWEAKIVVNAWWVRHDQVSRTAPTGEYLPAGSFMIRGKKNFLPSVQLQLGFGLMFRLDEESTQRHLAEKREKLTSISEAPSIDQQSEELSKVSEEDVELKDENDGQNSESDEEEFPDVEVNLDSLKIKPQTTNVNEEDFTLIQLGQPEKKVDERQKYLDSKNEELKKAEEKEFKKAQKKNAPLTKRQKHKLDKIRKKYANQDEEEREFRMQLMGTQASSVMSKFVSPLSILKPKSKKHKQEIPEANWEVDMDEDTKPISTRENSKIAEDPVEPEIVKQKEPIVDEEETKEEVNNEEDDEANEDDALDTIDTEQSAITSLTANPKPDDGILYVVAVCGPYSSVQKFKYKVKITPGTGKRGKAVKTALQLFLRDKNATQAEHDMVKSLTSDPGPTQQLPGKVRVSAPQLLKMKKN